MSIGRWLRAGAAVAAVAAFNASAPAAHAAPTPCGPGGTVSQGYVLDQYLLVKYDRLDDLSGLKLCFQAGGLTGPDRYGVLDIALPSASVGTPRHDNNASTCLDGGGAKLYESYTPGVGTVRISYLVRPSEVQLCSEAYEDDGTRLHSGRTLIPVPQVNRTPPSYGEVTPAPARDTSYIAPYPAGAPSSQCSGPGSQRILDFWNAADGTAMKISYAAPLLTGGTSAALCVRRQSAAGQGVGGRVKLDTTGISTLDVYDNMGNCTRPVHYMNAPAYLHIDETVSGNPKSICISTSPTNTTRLHFANNTHYLVTFTPDP